MKVSGRKNAKGSSKPQRQNRGGTKMTLSDDKPSRVRSQRKGSESERLESRKKPPANRAKAQPIGAPVKPRNEAA